MSLSGLMGFLAERVRDNGPERARRVRAECGPCRRGATGASLLGTTAEAGLLHFRGAFHNPAMLLPVTMPPIAAGCCLGGRRPRGDAQRPASRKWLAATAAMGVAGVAFHAYGVSRGMGGWRNWRQNAHSGPPLPAPPAFTGLALGGSRRLALMKEHARD
jgi:hypothetical protein